MTREKPLAAAVVKIAIARYAGVVAAKNAGVSLEEALANEGIEPSLWPSVERAFLEMVAAGESLDAFDRALATAADRYARTVEPLDHDLRAWLDVVRVFGASDAPLEWLRARGLDAPDMLRLHRAWSSKLERDEALRAEAASILSSPPDPVPPIVCGPIAFLAPPPDAEPFLEVAIDLGDAAEPDEPPTKARREGSLFDGAEDLFPSIERSEGDALDAPTPVASRFESVVAPAAPLAPSTDTTIAGGAPIAPEVALPFASRRIDETAAVDLAAARPALPFEASRSGEIDVSALEAARSIDAYAALVAAIAAWGEAEEVLRLYGVPSRVHFAELGRIWNDRFASDPEIARRFHERVASLGRAEPRRS